MEDEHAGDKLSRARRLRELTHEHAAALVINDRPDIAALVAAQQPAPIVVFKKARTGSTCAVSVSLSQRSRHAWYASS